MGVAGGNSACCGGGSTAQRQPGKAQENSGTSSAPASESVQTRFRKAADERRRLTAMSTAADSSTVTRSRMPMVNAG